MIATGDASHKKAEVAVMMKLKILNLDGFLETIGRCRGPVYQVGPDGSRTDLCRSASL